jgi:hypothetical protein
MRASQLGLGWQSHLLACRFGAHIEERADCIVLRTPSNPTYYWGNCLLLPQAPRDADVAHWLRRFHDEIAGVQPGSAHVAIGVDAAALPHAMPSWRAAGIDEFDSTAVLVLERAGLSAVPPAKVPVQVRPLRGPDDLDAVVEIEVASRHPSF